jgi:hypothetical protein
MRKVKTYNIVGKISPVLDWLDQCLRGGKLKAASRERAQKVGPGLRLCMRTPFLVENACTGQALKF